MKDIMFVSFTEDLHLIFDKIPNFDIVVLRYGNAKQYQVPSLVRDIIDVDTECKADIIYHSLKYLNENYKSYGYVGFIDDDIDMKVSQYENCLKIAKDNNLDLFAPSLSQDSNHSHAHTLHNGSNGVKIEPWVEVMMPTMSSKMIDVFKEPFIRVMDKYNFKSGWGIDVDLFPDLLKRINGKCGVIHQEVVEHKRPVTSGGRVFSNGMTSWQEWDVWKDLIGNDYVFVEDPEPREDIQVGKVCYINLDSRPDRKEQVESYLSKLTTVPYERFAAICPDFEKDILSETGQYHHFRQRFSPSVPWALNDKNGKRTAGMMGCYLSHYNLYKKLYDEGHDYAIVIEDDYIVTDEHIKYVRGMISQNKFPEDWDIIRDGWYLHDRGPHRFEVPMYASREGQQATETHNTYGGTHYILLNCKKIPKILRRLEYDFIYDVDGMLQNPALNVYSMKLKGGVFIGTDSDIPKTNII
jgi:GR25 family glycosyltransferase involved in LPS biosynthesis